MCSKQVAVTGIPIHDTHVFAVEIIWMLRAWQQNDSMRVGWCKGVAVLATPAATGQHILRYPDGHSSTSQIQTAEVYSSGAHLHGAIVAAG
jgi:hypothetical protein